MQALSERARQRLSANFLPVHLQALPPEQSKELFYALLFVPDLPETLREGIISRADGSPFYLEEIIRMLIENNVIRQDGDHWRMTPGADLSKIRVPDSLQDLILTRFDRLLPDQRRVVQTAAVIGYQFSAEVLKEVLAPLPHEEIQASVDWLVEREFILPDPGSFSDDYIFKHVLVSDAVYSTLLQRDRQVLHNRVAQAIEHCWEGRVESQVEILAGHFLRSPQLDRALHYLILAGQKAARDFANEQARQHFIQALGLLPRVPYSADQAVQIHMGLGDTLVTAGEYQAARNHFQTALELVETCDQNSADIIRQNSILRRKIGITFERQGDYDKALARLFTAGEAFGGDGTDFRIEQASILNDMGWIHSRRGKLDLAETNFRQALQLAESVGQIDVVASILNRLGGIFYQRDEVDQAAEYLRQSLELREKIGDIVNVARSYNNLGLLRWRQGNLEGALESFNHSFRLQSTLGDVEGLIELHINMGLIEIDRGSFSSAETHLKEGLAIAEQIGHSYSIGYAHHHLSALYVYQEDWARAIQHGKISQESFQQIGLQDQDLDGYTFIGLACLGQDNLTDARQVAAQVIELIQTQAGAEEEGRALRFLAGLARVDRDDEAACRHLERSAEIFKRVNNQMERARSLLELADLLANLRRFERAHATLAEAEEILQRMGVAFYNAKISATKEKIQRPA